jgi:tetratricopeptide (TPR) repeat protein
MLSLKNKFLLSLFILFIGCSSLDNNPSFNNIDNPFINKKAKTVLSNSFKEFKPNCIAILPFQLDEEYESNIKNINIQDLVRKTFYAHLSPLQYRDIELSKVDFYLKKSDNLYQLAKNINCEYFISGKIRNFEKKDIKVYSNIFIELYVELNKISEFKPLWKSSHSVNTHGGTIPLSPIGLAIGIIDAAKNLEEQQYVRVSDELIREIVYTFPISENILMANSFENLEKFSNLNKTEIRINNSNQNLSKNALEEVFFSNSYAQNLYDELKYEESYKTVKTLIKNEQADYETYFLKGRIELKLNLLEDAEQSFIKSVAINKETVALNALAYVYSINNKPFKAEAAYRMSIDSDTNNVFAHKNLGILLIKSERTKEALYYLDKAAFIALKTGKFHEYKSILTIIQSMKNNDNDIKLSIKNLKILEKKLQNDI